MKTIETHKRSKRTDADPRKATPRKSIDDRDLNIDKDATNAHREEEWNGKKLTDATAPSDRSVEEEEDREAKRKLDDANPAEDVQN